MTGYEISHDRDNHVIAIRRNEVSKLKTKYMSTRRISKELAEQGIVNPITKEPWSHNVIAVDIRELNKQNQIEAIHNTLEYRSEIDNLYREMIDRALDKPDIEEDVLLKAYKGLRELHGLDENRALVYEQAKHLIGQVLHLVQKEIGNRAFTFTELVQLLERNTLEQVKTIELPG